MGYGASLRLSLRVPTWTVRHIHNTYSLSLDDSYKRAHVKTPFRILSLQKTATNYDNKVDIYALGLVMVEIFCPFKTELGRFNSFIKMRREPVTLPEEFARDFPNQVMRDLERAFHYTAHQA